MTLAFDTGRNGSRLLVLLHGLGATREVWHPMLQSAETRWPGMWLAPDLRGHGRSAHAQDYKLHAHAIDISELVGQLGIFEDVVVLGHSMGGAIALALASGAFGFVPRCVFGFGIKVKWTDAELSQLNKVASAPPRKFETKNDAVERYLKVSGLHGLVLPESDTARAGVQQRENSWQLAADPATASVGPPDMPALVAAACAPFHLARGADDPMVTREDLLPFDPKAAELDGGHNVMVENPDSVWQWLETRLA